MSVCCADINQARRQAAEWLLPVRIAICGAHGVGKTTLAERLAERFSLPVISGVSRRVADKPQHSIRSTDDIMFALLRGEREKIENYQADVFSAHIAEEIRSKRFVSDRSALDIAAYSILYQLSPWHVKHYKTCAVLWSVGAYDLLIYLPPPTDWTPVSDGFRLTTKENEYNSILQRLLDDLDRECLTCNIASPVRRMPTVGLNERDNWLSMVINLVNEAKKSREEMG